MTDPVRGAAEPSSRTVAGSASVRLALGQQRWPMLDGTAPLVLVPVGSLEQHGPHLPLATDTMVSVAVTRAVAARLESAGRPVVVAPSVNYGASGEHEDFPGTISIGHEALTLLLTEFGRSACRWADGVIFVNGHGGNVPAVARAVRRLRTEGRAVAWTACSSPGGDAHAGATETSLLRHLAPWSVRVDLAVEGATAPIEELMPLLRSEGVRAVSGNGVLGDATGATAAAGQALFEAMVETMVRELGDIDVGDDGRLVPRHASTPRGRMTAGPAGTRLPATFAVRLSERTHVCEDGTALVGGANGSLLYLRGAAVGRVAAGRPVAAADPVGHTLCRLLLDRGYADPWWDTPAGTDADVADVTVVVPVLDRPGQLARLLAALPGTLPVVVVDDGSVDGAAVAAVAERYDARLVVHERNRGPSAARNTGLRAVRTPLVAFCDSDVTPVPGWLAELRRQFEDPAVGLAGPRVHGLEPQPGDGWLDRYEQARSSLDLGSVPALVRPGGFVSYLPGACLMGRVVALGAGFDERMRVAEDVDLVWRVVDAGWRVRYAPSSVVRHEHRTRLLPWLGRKAFYGTGAALLAERHGAAVAPMVLSPWSAVFAAALLAQRRGSLPVAAAAVAVTTGRIGYRLRGRDRPLRSAALLTAQGARATLQQTSSAMTRHYWPLAVLAATRSRRARRALLVAAVADGLLDRRRTGAALDPARYLLAHRLDDLAYGVGLWHGILRARTPRALLALLPATGHRSSA